MFFLARVLEQALKSSTSSDILFIMAAKISRRALKLSAATGPAWLQYVHNVVEATHREIETRWQKVENNTDPLGIQQAWDTAKLSFPADTDLTLARLRPYLAGVPSREDSPTQNSAFQSLCTARITQHGSTFPVLGGYVENRLWLQDVEIWVKDHLDEWLKGNMSSDTPSISLARLIKEYTSTATSDYSESPEEMSIMFLTAM